MLSSRFWSLLALTALVGCASGKVGTIAAPSDDSGAAQSGSDDGGDDGGTDVSSGSGTDGGGGDDGGDEGGDDGGDEGGDDGGDAGGDDGGSESDPLDTRPAGDVDYAASTESVDIDSDCEMDVTVLTPDAPPVGVVVVSHDQHFITACATEMWHVRPGRVEKFTGTFKDYKRTCLADAAERAKERAREAARAKQRNKRSAQQPTRSSAVASGTGTVTAATPGDE